jgi:hypothetical protein
MINSNNAIATIVNLISDDEWEEAVILFLSCYPGHRKAIASAVSGELSEENLDRWQMVSQESIDCEEIIDDCPIDTWMHIKELCNDVSMVCSISAMAY